MQKKRPAEAGQYFQAEWIYFSYKTTSSPGTELSCLSAVTKDTFIDLEVAAIMQSGSFRLVDFLISMVVLLISSFIFSITNSLRNALMAFTSFWVIFLNDSNSSSDIIDKCNSFPWRNCASVSSPPKT